MGVHPNIGYARFPEQSDNVGEIVLVCFDYDLDHQVRGEIVRDDVVDPYIMIIKLDDGRYVRSTECQYSFPGAVSF